MYLSKHISAQRPHRFNTSPSYNGVYLQKTILEKPAGLYDTGKNYVYLDKQCDYWFPVSGSQKCVSAPKIFSLLFPTKGSSFIKGNIVQTLFLFYIVQNKSKLSPDDMFKNSRFSSEPILFPLCLVIYFHTKRVHLRFCATSLPLTGATLQNYGWGEPHQDLRRKVKTWEREIII